MVLKSVMAIGGHSVAPETIQRVLKLHRHYSLHSHFRPKFGHEKEVLGTQKSLVAGGNGQAFDARYLLDF